VSTGCGVTILYVANIICFDFLLLIIERKQKQQGRQRGEKHAGEVYTDLLKNRRCSNMRDRYGEGG
jgi:hypothetical protein